MDSMKILSELYDLLSQCTPSDLQKAARSAGRDNDLSHALELMAQYRRQSSNVGKQTSMFQTGSYRSGSATKPKSPKGRKKPAGNGLRKKMSDVLLSKKTFSNNRELVKYLHGVGVSINLDPKDSRKRIVTKLFNWLDKLPAEKQKKTSLDVLSILPPSETAGWFDAMKSSNP